MFDMITFLLLDVCTLRTNIVRKSCTMVEENFLVLVCCRSTLRANLVTSYDIQYRTTFVMVACNPLMNRTMLCSLGSTTLHFSIASSNSIIYLSIDRIHYWKLWSFVKCFVWNEMASAFFCIFFLCYYLFCAFSAPSSFKILPPNGCGFLQFNRY